METRIERVLTQMVSVGGAALITLFLIAAPASAFSGSGAGTVADPYQITNATQLQEMQDNLGAYYVLANDIDCSDTVNWNGGLGFDPVGDNTIKFTETFDGQNHTITDLVINRDAEDFVGLFGDIQGADIRNVGLEDVSITGKTHLGGLVGRNLGTITNSYATGSVTSTHGDNCYAGGLVGDNQGTIINSYATGNVFSGMGAAGGLVGRNTGPITNSYATGNVTGISDLGGLIGANSDATITNCYYNNHAGNPSVGIGSGPGDCTAIGNNESYFYYSSNHPMSSWDFVNIWGINQGVSYPYLLWNPPVSCTDNDEDGYGVCPDCGTANGCPYDGDDCDDTNSNIFPGATEICNGLDDDCDGAVDEGFDVDGDGIADCVDNCPTFPNTDQQDSDADGVGNVCDNDDDNDGVPDSEDVDPLNPYVCRDVDGDTCDDCSSGTDDTANDGPDTDGDGLCNAGDNCPNDPDNDIDGDGVCGDIDNCLVTYNPGQTDTDGDGIGDACDSCLDNQGNDVDGDGICGDVDNCPVTFNPRQSDIDEDDAGDLCDICPADALDLCNPNGSGAWEIDPNEGGTIETPDGLLTIVIEPNDLDEFVTISVTQMIPPDPDVDIMIGTNPGWGEAIAVYDFEPDGLVFNNPVTVTITIDVTGLNQNQRDRLGLYLWEDPNFVLVEGADCSIVEDPPDTFIKTCTLEVDHFSIYAVVLPMWWDTLANGDLTGEGATDIEDLLIMAGDWLQSDSIADIAPNPLDNFVNLLDFAILAQHWLEGTVP